MRALREADRHKNRFMSILAHELRNPLSAISSAAQALTLEPHERGWVLEISSGRDFVTVACRIRRRLLVCEAAAPASQDGVKRISPSP